jgi:uncharacterized membrane protein
VDVVEETPLFERLSRHKPLLRLVLLLLFVGAGLLHLVLPDLFFPHMPPYLLYPKTLIYLSGMSEIAGGLGLQVDRVRRLAGYGLIALLIAVFPVNIHMFTEHIKASGIDLAALLLLVRLPLQFVFMALVYTATQPPE